MNDPLRAAQGTGLLAFQAEIDADYLLRFEEWHNCEHMPERVAIEGFIAGLRYRSALRSNRFLMCYRTQTPDVLSSAAYRAALDRPTDWTRESLGHFRNPKRNAYRLASSGGAGPGQPAPYLGIVRFEPLSQPDSTPAGVVAQLAVAVRATRWTLYEADRGATGIATSERQIYGGKPGEERFLAWIEMPLPDSWRAASAELDRAFPARTDAGGEPAYELYWVDFVLPSSRS